jgi:hypothetical protein
MIDLASLRVSLTKNGVFKVAELVKMYPGAQVLDHVYGDHVGINVVKSQIANLMDADIRTGLAPAYWDDIRAHGDHAIDALTVVALLFSHGAIIDLMRRASEGRAEYTGYFLRGDLRAGKGSEKAHTNLAYALACFGLSLYRRGHGTVEYNLQPVVYHLLRAGEIVHDLLRQKFLRAGWREQIDGNLFKALEEQRAHRVMSMKWGHFSAWLKGKLKLPQPTPGLFGLRDVGMFSSHPRLHPA